jgi:DNA-binding transcriptional ArsR family regulator
MARTPLLIGQRTRYETCRRSDVLLPADPRDVERIAASLKGVAHPTRLHILYALRECGALSPTQIRRRAEPVLPLSTVSHHMNELTMRRLVAPAGTRAVRGALEHFYELSPDGRRLVELVDQLVA